MSLPLIEHIEKDGFRLRGLEVSRIDAFSDVVFGFALTLLVVSLEVPKTYSELHASMRGFFPFAISFLFLMMIWYAHYKFFRRFGAHDLSTIVINAALLFVVLFYVYPLKFLFTFLINGVLGSDRSYFQDAGQIRELMILYGTGYAAIYLLITALYWNGLRRRKHLQLSPLESDLTGGYVIDAAGVAGIAVLSCAIAALVPIAYCGLAGWTFTLIYPLKRWSGMRRRRVIKKHAATNQPELTTTPSTSLESHVPR